jgi:pimeloyl-ACP methyl ester carboxylesterase
MRRWLQAVALALAALGAPALAAGRTTHMIERADGSLIAWHLENRTGRARQPVIIMLQGSGCESVVTNERLRWAAPRLAPGHALVTIEKYGVAPGDDGSACGADFHRGNSLTRRTMDVAAVAAALRSLGWWKRELVLFGGSEGGAVAAMAAPLVPETVAAIVWSSGIGLPVGEMIRQALPPQMAQEAPTVFAAARANPTGERQWAGMSHAWWADALDLVPARALAQTPAPVLIVHGTRDQSAPVASARAAADLVRASGKARFEYWEFEGYDHFMVDESGTDRRPGVVERIAAWLAGVRRARR